MSLAVYRGKRDFGHTPEPRGRTRGAAKRRSFVVQRHAASHLHYDFRLELDGVLKSWAVPKQPAPVARPKRQAVPLEDKTHEYGHIAGAIPAGHYGAGTVAIWDRGWWEPAGDPRAGYRKGSLKFILHGRKLKGGWALVRMRERSGDGKPDRPRHQKENWLLIKERDVPVRAKPRAR